MTVGMASLFMAFSKVELFDLLMPYDANIERIVSGARYGDDPAHRLDVYAPRGRNEALPIIVFFYGGGWDSGSRGGYGFAGAALAALGYVTVVPDYRLHPRVLYPDFLHDGAAAIAWARAHARAYGADPDRIILAGHSAGAYNASMLALDRRWLARAGVPQETIVGLMGLAGPYDFLPLDDPATIRTFSHVEDLDETQPVNYVAAASPPAFLATGSEDKTVYPRHTKELARRLRTAGVRVEEQVYSGIGHAGLVTAMARPLRWRAPVIAQMGDFLATIADRPEK